MLRNVGHSGLRGFGGSPRSGAASRPDGRRRSTFLQLTGAVLFLQPQALEQRLFDRRRPLRERTPPGGKSIPVIISSQTTLFDSSYISLSEVFWDGFDPVERSASNSEKSFTRRAHPASDFVKFAAKRFVRSSWTHKQICRAFQELSNRLSSKRHLAGGSSLRALRTKPPRPSSSRLSRSAAGSALPLPSTPLRSELIDERMLALFGRNRDAMPKAALVRTP